MEKIFDLKERSYQFGISVIRLVKLLPRNVASYVIVDQLIITSRKPRFLKAGMNAKVITVFRGVGSMMS